MYQADASGLFNVVSVTTWGQILDATASRAYEQVGDDHAPGRRQERDAALADVGARVTGVESEVPLGYAALHRLLLPFPRLVERLPVPQRDALRSTFGLVAGPPPDRFLIALGGLTLLADAASDAPLLCIVDDAQWLDPESAVVLGFVARRLQAEGIVMVFAARELSQVAPALQDLPEVVIGALDATDAASLLSSIAASRLSPEVESRLVAEGAGNPLALVELAAELTPAQLAGSAAFGSRHLRRGRCRAFSRGLRRTPLAPSTSEIGMTTTSSFISALSTLAIPLTS